MARSTSIRFCTDRIIPLHRKTAAAQLAVTENPANAPTLMPLMGVSVTPVKMALLTGKKWADGRTVRVRFLDGSKRQRAQTVKYAEEWCNYADIKFDFAPRGKADVRVSFQADPDSWSAIGVDCHDDYFKGKPTMNFGWLTDDTDETEWRRVVTHEFGHALGAIHEHQNPRGGIRWNLPAVYNYFKGPPNNWTKEEIDLNVVQKYSLDQLNATKFDRKSIMLYTFPAAFILGPRELLKAGTPNNTKLSAGDKAFIAKMYRR